METFFLCASIILFNNELLHATAVRSYPVRLTGGSNVYAGQIEVLHCVNSSSCTWRPVCVSNQDVDKATVTCRQLGLYSDNATTVSNSTVNIDSNAVNITCSSSEYGALGYCSISFITSCGSTDRVQVQCLSPPQRPSFSQTSYNTMTSPISATIQWTISTDGQSRCATQYQVRCSNNDYGSQTVSSQSYSLHSLEPCALYTCCVVGIDLDGAIGEENCVSFRTPISLTGVSGIPTGLEHMELQSQSVTLQWDRLRNTEQCNPLILYSVRVEGCNRIETNTTNTYTTITGLCPHSLYSISVKACNGTHECGEYSTALSVHTLEDVPTNVNNVLCHASSSKQVNITWDSPTQTNGVIRFYEIILNNINTTQNTTKYVESSTTSTTLSHLHPNHHYLCSVAAYSAAGRNTSAEQYVILPQSSPTGVPQQFSCSPQSPTSLLLDWRQPHPLERNGPIQNYSVIVWNLDTNEIVYSNITSYTPLPVHLLTSYHNYKCAVAANGLFGLGPYDNRKVWIPQTDHTFGPPANLQAGNITSTSFRVVWSEPSVRYDASVRIDHYRIQVVDIQENRTIHNHINRIMEQYFSDLHPNYHYRIEVSAIIMPGVQGPVASHSVQTSEDIPSGAPKYLSYFNVTSSSFTLTWNAPPFEEQNGDIVGYMVKVALHDSRRSQLNALSHSTVTTTGLSYTATLLTQNTRYEASVAAMTQVGVGPYSVPVSIDTMKLAQEDVIIASYVLSVVIVVVVILLISASLGLGWRIRKIKKTYKVQREMIQDQINNVDVFENTYREVVQDRVNNCDVIETTLHLESISTFNDSEKKVKPPAVPPKTYLELKTEIESEIETPSEGDAQSDDSDVDNCSVGSDSLYDLKLEKVVFQSLPGRIASQIAREPPRAIQGDKIPPRNISRSQVKSAGPSKSSKSVQITGEEGKDHANKHSNEADKEPPRAIQGDKIPPRNLPRSQAKGTDPPKSSKFVQISKEKWKDYGSQHRNEADHDYRKLDPKTLNPPTKYEDHHDLSSKPQHDKTTEEGSYATNRHASTGQENQYEALQLKTMNKPSEYQEIGQCLKTAH